MALRSTVIVINADIGRGAFSALVATCTYGTNECTVIGGGVLIVAVNIMAVLHRIYRIKEVHLLQEDIKLRYLSGLVNAIKVRWHSKDSSLQGGIDVRCLSSRCWVKIPLIIVEGSFPPKLFSINSSFS